MYLRTEAVVLKRHNFGEADRILTLYTRDFGKLSALAKGVRRPRSKKAGHVELGTWCKVFLARGKNIDLLIEVETKRAFGIGEISDVRANKIYHLLELVNNLTPWSQKNADVFRLLVIFLKKIEDQEFNLAFCVFKVKLLSSLGFFSAKNLKESSVKKLLELFEDDTYEEISGKVEMEENSYLKLGIFLDSMIEDIAHARLKTARFVYG